MIERLSGTVAARSPTGVVVDVNGVGYGVETPLSDLCDIPREGCPVVLWIDTYVREDVIRLFGFRTLERKQMFVVLRSVSGVGPKTALSILSTMSPRHLRAAVLQARPEVLETVPGIGKRLAEKLIVELKPKIEKLVAGGASDFGGRKAGAAGGAESANPGDSSGALFDKFDEFDSLDGAVADGNDGHGDAIRNDLISALGNFGWRERDVVVVVDRLAGRSGSADGVPWTFESALKQALIELRSV